MTRDRSAGTGCTPGSGRRDGPGLPGFLPGRPGGGSEGHPSAIRPRPGVRAAVRTRGRGSRGSQRRIHRTVVAAGPGDDPPWLATVFVPGPSLAEVIAHAGPLPEPAVWRLAGGLIEALQAVHARGLVHRDLKPANVLLAADGPRLIDFGISRALEGAATAATSIIVGTPAFMSPEQVEGLPVRPASDVFALGSVIAFAATGAAPLGAGTSGPIAMAYRVVHAQPDLSHVPVPLTNLVAACLTKNPAGRPQLAQLMVSRIGHLLQVLQQAGALAGQQRAITGRQVELLQRSADRG
jgi:serine/threonine protein kinase